MLAGTVHPRRLLWVWLTMSLLAVLPAGGVLFLTRQEQPTDSFAIPAAQARGLALALDAHLQRWLQQCEQVAFELSGLLGQLPAGELGTAAEGTLMLHLQQRRSSAPEMGELSLVDPAGKTILSTDGDRTGVVDREGNPEAAQVPARPAAVLVGRTVGNRQLVLVAPVQRGASPGGVLVARPRSELLPRLVTGVLPGVVVDLVDANGLSLMGRLPPALLDLGGESHEGRFWHHHRPVFHVPLQRTRMVVVVLGQIAPPRPALLRPWHLVVAVVLVLLSGLVAWAVTRQASWGRRSRGS